MNRRLKLRKNSIQPELDDYNIKAMESALESKEEAIKASMAEHRRKLLKEKS